MSAVIPISAAARVPGSISESSAFKFFLVLDFPAEIYGVHVEFDVHSTL